jgi:aminoglycoside 3'-phosphotransferase-2
VNRDAPPAVPPALQSLLAHYAWERDAVGESAASVFKLVGDGRPSLYLKREAESAFAELPGEAARLRWLATRGIPCPSVIAQETYRGDHWLLLDTIAGSNLAAATFLPAEQRVASVASALRLLHGLPPESCPFDQTLDVRLELARRRAEADLVDGSDFDEARRGQSPIDLLGYLKTEHPAHPDLVVTHGDATLENLMADHEGFKGFLDCGRLGVADRYQDLALANRSIRAHLGEAWVRTFFDHYALPEPDERKLHYYEVLDEFF